MKSWYVIPNINVINTHCFHEESKEKTLILEKLCIQ